MADLSIRNISDILTLAKNGYKKEDIKELLELSLELEERSKAAKQPEDTGATPPENPPTDSETESTQANTGANEEILQRLKELEEQNKLLTEQLAEAQKQNIDKDHSDQFTDTDPMAAVAELFRKG